MDFLSLTPSLPDILQFVEFDDVLNCQLVNRRIRDVIWNNSSSMPRQKVNVFISPHAEAGTKRACVRVSVSASSFPDKDDLLEIFIIDGCTIHDRPGFNSHNTDDELDPISYPILTAQDVADVTRLCNNINIVGARRFSRNNGIKEGMRTSLSFIVRKYFLNEFIILSTIPDAWQESIIETFKASYCQCRQVTVNHNLPHLERLVKAVDCQQALFHVENSKTFTEDILKIVSWSGERSTTVSFYSNKIIEQIPSLLQIWQNGAFSFNNLQLTEEIWKFSPPGAIHTLIMGLKHLIEGSAFILKNLKYSFYYRAREIFVERPIDNKVLVITYDIDEQRIVSIREYSVTM